MSTFLLLHLTPLFLFSVAAAISSPYVTWIAGAHDWRNCTFPVILRSPYDAYGAELNATDAEIVDVETGDPLLVRFHRRASGETESLGTTFRLVSSGGHAGSQSHVGSVPRIAEVSGFVSCAGNRTVAVRNVPSGEVVSGPHTVNVASPFHNNYSTELAAENRPASFAYSRDVTAGLGNIDCPEYYFRTFVTQGESPGGAVRFRQEALRCTEERESGDGDDANRTDSFQVDLSSARAAELGAPWLSKNFALSAPRWVTIDTTIDTPDTAYARVCDYDDEKMSFDVKWTQGGGVWGTGLPAVTEHHALTTCRVGKTVTVPISVPRTETLSFAGLMKEFVSRVEKSEGGALGNAVSNTGALKASSSSLFSVVAATVALTLE